MVNGVSPAVILPTDDPFASKLNVHADVPVKFTTKFVLPPEHTGATGSMTAVAFSLTVIKVVAGVPQGEVGVNVKATGPLSPVALKVVPVTPSPDQAPAGTSGSCKAMRL